MLSFNRLRIKVKTKNSNKKDLEFIFSLLIVNGLTENLTYVDLSGCIEISSDCLLSFVCSSKYLQNENLYFCDNLQSSLLTTANCCRNVENNSGRFCCRRRN
jgi:hypothetical protein